MKLVLFFLISFSMFSVQSQVAQELFIEKLNVHAINGLNLRQTPNLNSESLKKIAYGSVVKVLTVSDSVFFVQGLKGSWAKVNHNDTIGFVFSAYLSKLPVVELSDRFLYLKDYVFSKYAKTKGDEDFKFSEEREVKINAEFSGLSYEARGFECDSKEGIALPGIGVQEAFIVFSAFNWNFRNISFAPDGFKWSEDSQTYRKQYYLPTEYLTLEIALEYIKDESNNFTFIEIFMNCDAGGGFLKFEEKEGFTSIRFEYGCH